MVRTIFLRFDDKDFRKIEKIKKSISGASWERFVYGLIIEKDGELNGS